MDIYIACHECEEYTAFGSTKSIYNQAMHTFYDAHKRCGIFLEFMQPEEVSKLNYKGV